MSEELAWKAYDNKEFAKADQIWTELLASERDETRRYDLFHGYAYTLCALRKFDLARLIYEHLYLVRENHIYLHQLGMVERERGDYALAFAHIESEAAMIEEGKTELPVSLALAANYYEQAKILELMKKIPEAKKLAEVSFHYACENPDEMVLGCSLRLLGDIALHADQAEAKDYYAMAKLAFEEAGDEIAVSEMEQKIGS